MTASLNLAVAVGLVAAVYSLAQFLASVIA
jgi:hypothetical protein